MEFKGIGFYDKYEGELIELGNLLLRDVGRGEVWQGSKEDFNETFNQKL